MDRGSQLDEEDDEEDDDEDDEDDEDDKDDKDDKEDEEERRRRRRTRQEEATDIKSNNPHLAGGEKHRCPANMIFLQSPVNTALLVSRILSHACEDSESEWSSSKTFATVYPFI